MGGSIHAYIQGERELRRGKGKWKTCHKSTDPKPLGKLNLIVVRYIEVGGWRDQSWDDGKLLWSVSPIYYVVERRTLYAIRSMAVLSPRSSTAVTFSRPVLALYAD